MYITKQTKSTDMILNYIEGYTAYNLTIDGVEVSELPLNVIADVIRHLVGRCKDKGVLKEMLETLIESDNESVCDISRDQCGDDIYNYKLEIY